MSKWPTADHFASWLNLSPSPKVSGGKLLGHQKKFTNNRATQMFRMAAQTMWQHKGTLGALYKRLSSQKGSKKAIKAVARKLSVIFYHVVRNKSAFDAKKRNGNNIERQQKRDMARLKKKAAEMGYVLQQVGGRKKSSYPEKRYRPRTKVTEYYKMNPN